MTRQELFDLGWVDDGYWNNRDIFSIGDYSIFEHNGDYGIWLDTNDSFELVYCNMTDDEIKDYTNMVKTLKNITEAPDDYTVRELQTVSSNMAKFINKMKERS